MEAVIIQHLLSTELKLLEQELVHKSAPSGPATHLLRTHTRAAHIQVQADCKHLEATVAAARCEHAAADTAVYTALQLAGQQLRTAQQELREQQELQSTSRQELLHSQETARHRASLLPSAAIVPGMVGRDGASPSAGTRSGMVQATGSRPWAAEELAEQEAFAAVVAFCEALEPEAEDCFDRQLALAPAAAAPNACQQAPSGALDGNEPTGDRPVPHHVQSAVVKVPESALLGSARARLLHLLRVRLVAPCSSAHPGWPPATAVPATASGARASPLLESVSCL